jgi:DNA-binding response OmpR family regulator
VPQANLSVSEPRTTALLPETLARKHHVVPLRADDRTIRMATSDPRDLDEEKALDLGAHDYLRKPVQTRSLVARVRAVLKRVTS